MAKLKTVDIGRGSEYVQVDERLRYLRENYPNASLLSEMLSNENGVCIFKTSLVIDDKVVATGHAYEKEGSTFINKTSYIENAETSSWGRCLGQFGIGIQNGVASADEVANAILQQEAIDTKVGKALAELTEAIGESDDKASVEIWRDIKDKVIQDGVWKALTSTEHVYLKQVLADSPV